MSVLVTGGAGYIGSIVSRQLLAAGEEVVVLDDFSTGYRDAVAVGTRLVEGSVLNGVLLRRVLEEYKVDTVFHFAAYIVVSESCADPSRYFQNNVAGALSVLDAVRSVGTGHFILSSTAAVYGEPERVPVTEDMPTRPKNPYGLSKLMIEQTLEWYDKAYGLKSVSLRYFNACGAFEELGEAHVPETHLIPNVLSAASGDRPAITIYGNDYDTPDGTCIRDYVHVVDLADAHILARRYLRAGGASDTFNLGSSVGHSVLEVVESARRVTGLEVPVEFGPRRSGDADRLVAASDKARAILGWVPSRDHIDVMVGDAWKWRQAHPRGYAR